MSQESQEARIRASAASDAAQTVAAAASTAATAVATAAATAQQSLTKDIEYIKRDLGDIKLSVEKLSGVYVTHLEFDPMRNDMDGLSKVYVTSQEFKPVKQVVYGLVALILTAVIGAVIALVLRSSIHL